MALDNIIAVILLPVFGKLSDDTNTKWGKFRPWLLIGTLINAVVLIFLFINPAKFLSGKMVYGCHRTFIEFR